MNIIRSKIWHSSSVRNVGKLLSANVLAQAIGLVVYPVLTRIYSPEDFGLLNLFSGIAGVLILLSTLEWYNAIVLPEKEEEGRTLVHLSLLCIGALTLVLAVSVPFAPVIARAFNSPELAHYWWMMPVYVLLTGGWNVLNYWYIRRKAYGRISGYQISQSLFSAGFKTGFGFMPLNGGLLYATVLSPLCSLALSVSLAAKSHLRALRGWDWSACRTAAKTYANFPKYSTPRALLNNVIGQLPVLVLTPLFGMRLVGFWGMALMLAFVPVSTVTRALYQVMYAWATEQVNARKRMLPFYRSFTLWTLVILLPLLAALWFVLPAFTAWLLGNEWSTTGEYIRWMLPWVLCSVLCSSTGYMTDIFFQQKKGLYFEIALALTRVAGVGLGIACNNFTVAIAGYSIGSALVNGVQYGWFISLVRTYEKTISPNG